MSHRLLPICFLACLFQAAAQLPFAIPPGAAPPIANTDELKKSYPLGRGTPRGTMLGFLGAARRENYDLATKYMQFSSAAEKKRGEILASELAAVIDRQLPTNLDYVSDSLEGSMKAGPDKEVIGKLRTPRGPEDFALVRVTDPTYGPLWLISKETLALVPELYADIAPLEFEDKLPEWMVKKKILSMPLWQWFAGILLLPVAYGIVLALGWLPGIMWRQLAKHYPSLTFATYSGPRPMRWFFALLLHAFMFIALQPPLLVRNYYGRIFRTGLLAAVMILVWRWADWFAERVHRRLESSGEAAARSIFQLARRVTKVLAVALFVLLVLNIFGFKTDTVLAGLGLAGFAVTLASQETLKNIFAGVSVLADHSIRVGDTCKIGDRVATVEDIGLRATRFRTQDNTALVVPNSTVGTLSIENFASRRKIWMNPVIGLRYETSPDQLRAILAAIRRLLYEHPKIESSTSRARLSSFGASALNIDMFAYVLTPDFAEFAAIREDILLRIIGIVRENGSDLAFNSSTVYLAKDSGLDKGKASEAEQLADQWRKSKTMPFPDYTPEEISQFENRLPYPPPESGKGG
jgi:MscS family membrane protein